MIKVEGLKKNFGTLKVLDGISFELEEGKSFGHSSLWNRQINIAALNELSGEAYRRRNNY